MMPEIDQEQLAVLVREGRILKDIEISLRDRLRPLDYGDDERDLAIQGFCERLVGDIDHWRKNGFYGDMGAVSAMAEKTSREIASERLQAVGKILRQSSDATGIPAKKMGAMFLAALAQCGDKDLRDIIFMLGDGFIADAE